MKTSQTKKPKIERKWNYLVIDGEYYEVNYKDGAPIFKKVKKSEINKKLKKVREIIKELKEGVDVEAILEEKLMSDWDDENLDKIYNLLFKSKRKYKPKTRKHHCVDLKVGNLIIPLVD